MKREGQMVEVIRSPDTPHLMGRSGAITHKEGKWTCVKIGERFTHFRNSDIRVVGTA